MNNSSDLDMPEWATLARKTPLTVGDVLFRDVSPGEEDEGETNAVIRQADGYAYAEGYRLAGQVIADHAIRNPMDSDFLLYPVAFLYRHTVELQLKRLIPQAASLGNCPLSEGDSALLRTSHDLNQLWRILKPTLEKGQPKCITQGLVEGLDWYIGRLAGMDRLSFGFRYAVTKTGRPSLTFNDPDRAAINIRIFAEGMERLTCNLFGLGEFFREQSELNGEIKNEYEDVVDLSPDEA